jgi:hypothetical protein
MGYADLDAAKHELGLSDNEPGDAFDIARLAVFDAAFTLRFDALTGRTWGTHAAEERTIRAPGVSSLLILDVPVSGLSSVETGGTWNGTAWDDGTTVDASYLRLTYGGRAIERTDGGYWTGDVRVTGTWDDEVNGAAPADVVAAVTEAVVAEHRRRTFNARQTAQSFDEIDASPPPNPLSGPLWKAAVATHAAKRLVLA